VEKSKAVALGFQHSRTPAGIPASLENAIVALNTLGLDCRYDIFHDRIIVKGKEYVSSGDVLENLENVTLKVRQAVLGRFGFDPGMNFMYDALRLRCLDRVFDPVWDYLDGLKWDGTRRLDTWLTRYCRAADTALNRAIGRKMLIAGVRRVRSPGCKFDYIVVLEGKQGVGKSSLLRVLAGEENFSDNEILGLDKRDQQESIQGVWIYEVAELDGLHKSDVTKVKLFASKTVDSARPAYGRSRVDRLRRGIFVATTNEDTYLRDTTGNRRFWPVAVGKIDLAAIQVDRDQLWAEACQIEAQGEPLVIPEALWPDAQLEQQARMELDPWEDAILAKLSRLQVKNAKVDGKFALAANALGDPEWRVSSDYLLTDVIGLPKERQNNNHTKRLASLMRGLGWDRNETVMRIGSGVARGFTQKSNR
jgi:predicted P-loop ATPase